MPQLPLFHGELQGATHQVWESEQDLLSMGNKELFSWGVEEDISSIYQMSEIGTGWRL